MLQNVASTEESLVKLDDIVDSLVIDPRKLTEYALNYSRHVTVTARII